MEPDDRPAGRPRDPRTEAAVIDAVLDLVGDGATLSGLSLVTIAKHAGISRNSLYRRWNTKDALYLDVLGAINLPLPAIAGRSARENLEAHLAVLVERTIDKRANRLLRALNAEAESFPELHRRYFDEIVAPRREAVHRDIREGIASGEIRPDVDVAFAAELLVGPILARMSSGATDDLDPAAASRRLVELVFAGLEPK